MAIALSKKGHYEWEEFRQELISTISEWEAKHCQDDPEWDYYERWLLALEKLLLETQILSRDEIEKRTAILRAGATREIG
jgi:nitrile hydratase accessory protein